MVVWRHLIIVLISYHLGLSQSTVPLVNQKLKGRYEFGFTPRFSLAQDFKIRKADTSFTAFQGTFRMQAGKEFMKNNYISLFFDYHIARTSISFYPNYDAFTFGLIYQKKFCDILICDRKLKLFNRNIKLIIYPEIFGAFGITNLQNKFNLFPESNAPFNKRYFNYGVAFNFYLSKYFNFQLSWPIEYHTGLYPKQAFYRNTLTQLVLKL